MTEKLILYFSLPEFNKLTKLTRCIHYTLFQNFSQRFFPFSLHNKTNFWKEINFNFLPWNFHFQQKN